jgi:hypothetical protein
MGRVGAMFRNAATLAVGVAVTTMMPSSGAFAHAGIKDVPYRGLTLRVPASWPVFRLTDDSRTCVRFNRHALYLGTPSLDQACPANALGRTEAILAEPEQRDSSTLGTAGDGATSAEREISLVRDGLSVTATWGSDPGVVERALGLHSLPQQATGEDTLSLRTMSVHTHATTLRSNANAAVAGTAGSGPVGPSTYTGLAFDTCSAPTSTQLSAWKHSPYHGMGVYIGGSNAGCPQSNLTSSWVSAVTGAGWHLVLIYVGLQAPRNSCGCAPIDPASATAQGSAAADDAASRAASLGVGHGSPLYYDMEGYTETGRIRNTVLNFLAAWTSELHHDGYRSGVYSSADSGITDLVSRYGSGYPEPDDLWFSEWDGQASTTAPFIPSNEWAKHHLAHQFLGGHDLSYGGLRMSVDSDYWDAGTVGRRASSTSTPSGPGPSTAPRKHHHRRPGRSGTGHHHHPRWPWGSPPPASPTGNGALVEIRGTHTVFTIVGGAPVLVKYWADIGGRRLVRQISRRRFEGLRAVPADGSLVYTATGTVYRIAGGFPFVLTRAETRRSGAQLIDVWDIRHLSDPSVHLHAAPSNGTVIRAAPSGRLWAFEDGHLFRAWDSRDAVAVPDSDLGPWLSRCPGTAGQSGGTRVSPSCRPGNDSPGGSDTGGGGVLAAL